MTLPLTKRCPRYFPSLIDNLLGAIYIDQEKGWTLLNRGKAIAGVHFNINELPKNIDGIMCSQKSRALNSKNFLGLFCKN